MRREGRVLPGILAVLGLLVFCGTSLASIIDSEEGDFNYRVDGRLRETFGVGYNRILKGSRFQLIDNSYLLESVLNASWRNEIRFKMDLVLNGDAVYQWRRNSDTFGSRNVDTTTGQNGVFKNYGSDAADREAFRTKCENSPDCNFLRDHLLRELSLIYANKEIGLNVTIGKFQRGIGQADGLRLMDVINPLDFRKRFLLRDFDELRIEQWMVDAIFFTQPYFDISRFGIIDPNFEVVWIPNVRHTEFGINNRYNGESGGIWAFDLPYEDAGFDNTQGVLPPGAYFDVSRTKAQDKWIDPNKAAWAGRIAWKMFEGEFSLNAYWGYQDLFVTRLKGATVHAGTDGRGPVLLEADNIQSEYAYYTLVQNGTVKLGQNCDIGGLGLVTPPGGCSVVGHVEADFNERKKLFGITATRELGFIRVPPRDVSPVLRVEASYEFDKPFNTTHLVTTDGTVRPANNYLIALNPAIPGSIRELDFLSVLVGEDFFFWLPSSWYYIDWVHEALFYQPRGIFTSFQVFYFKAMGNGAGDRRVLFQSPYPDWKRPQNEFWMTFLFFTDIAGDKIHVEGLNVYEVAHASYILRQRFDFKYFGDHFFPRLEIIHFEGRGDQVGGVFDDNDMVSVDLQYQF